ncbi:hypothetical protein NCAS_0F02840 [Naumovozyma castellii]|uniref:Cyclin N-terminal domain-containing protein n=1 Tax=Naumovozyma castellii TaxID=27288 RepID=G0VGZ7_NAUCA|nr:hypothetical protein NCAS_0F02840 [Naumovozyma castellii CBS 4309]CCC70768.1 hypothetical protein NCAS_0F02840 [Naumovozyma castellii CBS 4309]
MEQVTPITKEDVKNQLLTDKKFRSTLNSNCIYQTPPYEPTQHNHNISGKISSPSSPSSSNKLFIINIASFLSTTSKDYSTPTIPNDFKSTLPFLNEIIKRSKSNKKIVLLATFYFHRLHSNIKNTSADSAGKIPDFAHSIKRTFLNCLILAHKFSNDITFSMKTWSLITGLQPKNISTMERWCLKKLNFQLFVSNEQLLSWETETFLKNNSSSIGRKKHSLSNDFPPDENFKGYM